MNLTKQKIVICGYLLLEVLDVIRSNTTYELRVQSLKARVDSLKARVKIQKRELKSAIYDFKFTSYEYKSTTYEFKSLSCEFRSTIIIFGPMFSKWADVPHLAAEI